MYGISGNDAGGRILTKEKRFSPAVTDTFALKPAD
jgi:hypothetical protein